LDKATRLDLTIRIAAAVTVLGVTGIAAVISYQHIYELAVRYGETGATARALPLTVDGLILMCSLVMLDSARHGERAPGFTWVLLGSGIIATMAANVAHGIDHGWGGAITAAWPAAVTVGSFELLACLIRRSTRVHEAADPAAAHSPTGTRPDPHPGTLPAPSTDPGTDPAAGTPAGTPQPAPAPVPDDAPESAPVPDAVPVPALDEEPQDARVPAPAPAAPAAPGVPVGAPGGVPGEVLERAVQVFAADLAAGRVPGQRAIKRTLQVGQSRARQVQAYLGGLAGCTAH